MIAARFTFAVMCCLKARQSRETHRSARWKNSAKRRNQMGVVILFLDPGEAKRFENRMPRRLSSSTRDKLANMKRSPQCCLKSFWSCL